MKKRDFTSAFENDNSISTGISLDEAVHGLAPKLDTGRIVARPISIFEIYPDPMQPRRAIPSSVRKGWTGDPRDVEGVLWTWVSAVKEESKGEFDLDSYLLAENDVAENEGKSEKEAEQNIGPLEAALLGIVNLAMTIKRDKLTNPITVLPVQDMYQLETGERRWLAYHLLHANFPDGEWAKIPARVLDVPNRWRQAAENNARDNLNAIAKARQYALLLMDVLSKDENSPVRFKPFDAFENEREFYAQVAKKEVPKGKNATILSVMGVEHRNASSRLKALLRLPDEVWRLADDFGWPERRLRPLTTLPPHEAIRIAQQWAGVVERDDVEKDLFVESERDLKRISRRIQKMSQAERIKLAERFESLARMIRRGEL